MSLRGGERGDVQSFLRDFNKGTVGRGEENRASMGLSAVGGYYHTKDEKAQAEEIVFLEPGENEEHGRGSYEDRPL